MLDFRNVFSATHQITSNDIPIIMKCKNIDFGHVNWQLISTREYLGDTQLMFHLIDNVLDVDIRDNYCVNYFTLFVKIAYYTNNHLIVEYMSNNGGVTNFSYTLLNKSANVIANYKWYTKYEQLVKYLTDVSLNKFTKYYNIVKYYDICYLMLLITRVQKKVPKIVIRHLIVPFIYQR